MNTDVMGAASLTKGRKPRLMEAVLMREMAALVQYRCLQSSIISCHRSFSGRTDL